jgi:hypothetical protein
MSADPCISQNSRKAKHNGPDTRLSHRKRRETGIISYHHAVPRNLTAYFALGGVIVGLRPISDNICFIGNWMKEYEQFSFTFLLEVNTRLMHACQADHNQQHQTLPRTRYKAQ